ncbi:MAG: DMT family transporter [Dongiaceae bacterium]
MPIPALYLVTVLIWGTSWYAMELQLGVVAIELSIVYRYLLAAGFLLLFCLATGRRLRFGRVAHGYMAAQGLLLFSINYLLFYWAANYLISGLLAVCFSTIVVMNIVNGALFFRQTVDPVVAVAAVLGLGGLGLVFWPEIAGVELSHAAAFGLLLSLVATYLASLGNMISVRYKQLGIPVIESNALGMAYGALFTLVVVLVRGVPIAFDPSAAYVGSLAYLALFASVIGFGCYLTLVQRIGADRAAYTSVLFPVVALGMSTLLEGYRWTLPAALGVLLVLAGNLLVLMRRRRPVPTSAPLPVTARSCD